MTEAFGKTRSVFGGAIRAYMPGFTEDCDINAHRLVLPDHVSDVQSSSRWIKWIRNTAASESIKRNKLGKSVIDFISIRDHSLALRQILAEKSGASDAEQLELAKNHVASLQRDVDEFRLLSESYLGDYQAENERANLAEKQLYAANLRVQQLLGHLESEGFDSDAHISIPESWTDFEDWCDGNLVGRVALSSLARKGIRDPLFRDPALVARCLRWLAGKCRDTLLNGGDSIDEEYIEEGIKNTHCGGDTFPFKWQGQSYFADWHIKTGGNTRDPTRCLRIYYGWDAVTQQIIVGDMPAHRRTDAS